MKRTMPGKTISERRALLSELSKKFESWIKMTDAELLGEVQKVVPAIRIEASREECLKILTMDHTSKMVGG